MKADQQSPGLWVPSRGTVLNTVTYFPCSKAHVNCYLHCTLYQSDDGGGLCQTRNEKPEGAGGGGEWVVNR